MDTDQIARGGGPEPTAYDRGRHEAMRLKPFSPTYGKIRVGLRKELIPMPGTCLKCAFDEDSHTCGR